MSEYYLKWKDINILKFNTDNKSLVVINSAFLPISLVNMMVSYDMITKFCSDRVLMFSRKYCSEILKIIGVEKDAVAICIACKGLSLRDNYWIENVDSNTKWQDVNFYKNNFSSDITEVALTGRVKTINNIGLSCELTSKGTKAKCYYRNNGNLYLFKSETDREISVEIASYYIAQALGVVSSQYSTNNLFGCKCSACQIFTDEENELIPYRDILSAYSNKAYDFMMSADAYNFILMQIFDYVTLNIDRNRDNFGLLQRNGSIMSMYPLFDHDSCFKGKGTNAVYFPSGKTFASTLEFIKSTITYRTLNIDLIRYNLMSSNLKSVLLSYITIEDYNSMLTRVKNL